MAVLAQLFSARERGERDGDKLLHLYWNRAELKKQYARLRNERHDLLDRLKAQEGRNARLRHRLESLEELLADREAAGRAIAFYQIRSIWRRCHAKLEDFAGRMAAQMTERERERLVTAWSTEQAALRRKTAAKLDRARARRRDLEAALRDIEERAAAAQGIRGFFRRRSVQREREAVREELACVVAEADTLSREFAGHRQASPPDPQRLSVQGRRIVNCMVLALAEYLYLHFERAGLIEMARAAVERTPGSIDYGSEEACARLLQQVAATFESLDAAEATWEYGAEIRERTRELSERVRYETPKDTVPVAESLDPGDRESGGLARPAVNVLSEECWHVTDVLLA
ncbi:MAG: hypothetical protein P8172_10575 [Gammaproteobacteria bacterium]